MSGDKHGTRTQLATTRLRQMITAGDLRPGQRVAEREIAEQLPGLSRTPLREALKILATEGLLTLSPNRGATVTMLSMAEVEDVLELTVGLESLAAEHACMRVSDAEIAEIGALQQKMREAFHENRLMDYFEINQLIHQRIVEVAGNRELARIHATQCARIKPYRYAGNRRHERWERALAEHEQIFMALQDRNGALLREMLSAHHRNGWKVTKSLVEQELSRT